MENKYELATNKVKKYGQEQLLQNYEKLDKEKQNKLLNDILTTDFDQINDLYNNMNNYKKEENFKIEEIPYVEKERLGKEEKEYYINIGRNSIEKGQYAVITMAGGQRNKTWSYWTKRNLCTTRTNK